MNLQRISLESVGAKEQFAASQRKLCRGRLSNNELGDWWESGGSNQWHSQTNYSEGRVVSVSMNGRRIAVCLCQLRCLWAGRQRLWLREPLCLSNAQSPTQQDPWNSWLWQLTKLAAKSENDRNTNQAWPCITIPSVGGQSGVNMSLDTKLRCHLLHLILHKFSSSLASYSVWQLASMEVRISPWVSCMCESDLNLHLTHKLQVGRETNRPGSCWDSSQMTDQLCH